MLGAMISFLLMGYVGLMVSVEIIPLITAIDISGIGGGTGIVWTLVGIAQWMIPLTAVVMLVLYGTNKLRGR